MKHPPGTLAAIASAFLLAALSTFGDWVWARYIPTHQMIWGLVHGALICAAMGAALCLATRRWADLPKAAGGALVIGLFGAGAFYLLFPAIGWAAMFVAWMLLWVLLAALHRQLGGHPALGRQTWIRGGLAALLSGLAFWAISGIWLDPPATPDYPLFFAYWMIAFLPGFLALFVELPAED